MVIGRDADCDIPLPDQSLSRHHARLTPALGGVELTDLQSSNGCFVNGHKVSQKLCKVGDLLRVGNRCFLVVPLAPPCPSPNASEGKGPLIGGLALAAVRRTLGLVGPTDISVLLLGETGTGKDVVARALHEQNEAQGVRTGPFVAVNCAALPEQLVESEMFGHVQGAFTGARAKKGLLSIADGGTLFLDEVGELPLPAQAKLLRVLEDGEVRPVGSSTSSKVHVRFVSATNRDLAQEVEAGSFRRDLLARLAGVELHLPALRDRREDLPAMLRFLSQRSSASPGGASPALSPDAWEALLLHQWPGNVRELDGLVRLLLLCEGEATLEDLPPKLQAPLREARRSPAVLCKPSSNLEERVTAAMHLHGGNIRQAAITVGVARSHMYRLLKKLSLDPASFRTGTGLAEPPSK